MNINNRSIKQNLVSQLGKSQTDFPLRSTTRLIKMISEESLSQTASEIALKQSSDSLTKPIQKSSGVFNVAGIEFRYSIVDGKRFINDMPAEEFMKTLSAQQLLAIAHVAVIKSKLNE